MKTVVAPDRVIVAPVAILSSTELRGSRIALFEPARGLNGDVGNHALQNTVKALGSTPSVRANDLVAFALAVLAADKHVNRLAVSPDGWTRELALTVALREPEPWIPHIAAINEMLRFLTGDIWSVSFISGGRAPLEPRQRTPRSEGCVCLLSGGLDSLIGAIDLSADSNRRPFLVSSIVRGERKWQTEFAGALVPSESRMAINPIVRAGAKNPELSQRPRSLAFVALGVLAASTLDKHRDGEIVDLFMPENGFISLNVPLTPLRVGSLSTRTTHPFFVKSIQALLEALGLHVRLLNPYQYMTKGEMLVECADQGQLRKLAHNSVSCARAKANENRQCGRCLPCLVRRAAFHYWSAHGGAVDETPYKFPTNQADFRGAEFAEFDDVMQCREAIATVQSIGVRRWIGPAIGPRRFDDPEKARATAARGLAEIEVFLNSVGLA